MRSLDATTPTPALKVESIKHKSSLAGRMLTTEQGNRERPLQPADEGSLPRVLFMAFGPVGVRRPLH